VLDIEPDWSPNGRQIAFQRIDLNGCGPGCETDEIDVVNSDGSHLTRLAYDAPGKGCVRDGRPAGGVCREVPAWSPNGRRIAFECEILPAGASNPHFGRICVMNPDGSNVRRLVQTPATGVNDSAPGWSPDGREIAFQRSVQSKRGDTIHGGVFVMNAAGSDPRRLTPWALRAGQPDWSPDGKRILFYSNWDGPAHVSANLYTISPNGSGLRQLTHARGGKVQYLSATFSPDGKSITFGRTPGIGKDGNADVFAMRGDGTHMRNVTRSAVWDSGADWGPRP
jgi:TolB protein